MDSRKPDYDRLLARMADLELQLAELKDAQHRAERAENRLLQVADGIHTPAGPDFFQSLVDVLTKTLNTDFAIVGQLAGEQLDKVKILALTGFSVEPGFTYDLTHTPCRNVINQTFCSYPEGVARRFPKDRMLTEAGVSGYVGTPVYSGNGDLMGLIAVMTREPLKDVSSIEATVRIFAARAGAEMGRARGEDQRQRLHAQIQHAQRLRSIGVLAGGIAHDFNNLLVGILGNAGLALRRLPEGSPLRRTIAQIENAGQRAAELTQQLLLYAGKGKATRAPLDLSALVEEIAALLKASLNGTTQLNFNLAENLPAVEVDPGQIRQVVMNLLTNASEALGGNPGKVNVATGTVEISQVELNRSVLRDPIPGGTYAYVEVTDTGSGMHPGVQERIFDPFYSTKLRGRGLGLSALLGIVRSHQGAIFLDSKPGSGTTFRVLFPVSGKPAMDVDASTAHPVKHAHGGMVLVVDDEEVVRDVARISLDEAGYKVMTAADVNEASALIAKYGHQLRAVLLDVAMPEGSGPELMEEILTVHDHLPVILSSGYSPEEVRRRYGGGGESRFLQKPYGPSQLLELLDELLGDPPQKKREPVDPDVH